MVYQRYMKTNNLSIPIIKTHLSILLKKHFNEILDLYPEFLRPKILKIFKTLTKLKKKG